MTDPESQYTDAISSDIEACLTEKGVQPILFLGSGVSRRYFDAPDWRGLLSAMVDLCPSINRDLAYYEQSHGTLPKVGQRFAELFKEWAWGGGKKKFPANYFDSSFPQEIFLKHQVAEYLSSITPSKPPRPRPIPLGQS